VTLGLFTISNWWNYGKTGGEKPVSIETRL